MACNTNNSNSSIDMSKIDALFEAGDSVAPTAIIHGNIHFSIDLFKQIQQSDKNLIYSPYSISTALGMLYAGAKEETADQIQQVLHFPSPNTKSFHQNFALVNDRILAASKDSITLHSANKIWFKEGFSTKDGFTEITKAFYHSDLGYYKDAISGSKKVNEWASLQTKEKIQDIVKADDLISSKLILANAIYFHGNWAEQFDSKRTRKDTFWKQDKPIITDFMDQEVTVNIGAFENVDVFSLDYKGKTTSMMIVLPNEDVPLENVVAELSMETYLNWCNKLDETDMYVKLPKWKFTPPTILLVQALKDLGLTIPFSSGAVSPNFENIAPEIYVGNILHKAMIEVNEEGAEAAAVTVVVMPSRSIRVAPPSIKVNRPFLYFIKDNSTNSILFMGQVIDPSKRN
jgi:serpin B